MVPSVCLYYAILDYEFAADTISAGKANVMDAEAPIGFDPPTSLINGKSGGGVFELNLRTPPALSVIAKGLPVTVEMPSTALPT